MTIDFVGIGVKRAMLGQFRISSTMELKDGADVLFSYPFGCDYKPGDNVSDRIDALEDELQDALDNYMAEETLRNSPALSNRLDTLKAKLTIPGA